MLSSLALTATCASRLPLAGARKGSSDAPWSGRRGAASASPAGEGFAPDASEPREVPRIEPVGVESAMPPSAVACDSSVASRRASSSSFLSNCS
jgi:hypothetical protein